METQTQANESQDQSIMQLMGIRLHHDPETILKAKKASYKVMHCDMHKDLDRFWIEYGKVADPVKDSPSFLYTGYGFENSYNDYVMLFLCFDELNYTSMNWEEIDNTTLFTRFETIDVYELVSSHDWFYDDRSDWQDWAWQQIDCEYDWNDYIRDEVTLHKSHEMSESEASDWIDNNLDEAKELALSLYVEQQKEDFINNHFATCSVDCVNYALYFMEVNF